MSLEKKRLFLCYFCETGSTLLALVRCLGALPALHRHILYNFIHHTQITKYKQTFIKA